MTNAQNTKAFFAVTDSKTKAKVLANIAGHYGISQADALVEVTDDEAESLLDYMTEPARAAVSVLLQKHRLAA